MSVACIWMLSVQQVYGHQHPPQFHLLKQLPQRDRKVAGCCFQGYGCTHKISTGSGISPRRLGEERGKLNRNNNYNKAYFGLRIYICPAEAVQLGVSCVVGLLLTQNFNRVWCQSLKTWGGERETLQQ